ncbi:helix-turn-helix domain-containing protein, partial [Lactococcus lactis]
KELLENPEDQKLVEAMYKASSNQTKAAKILYVHRNTLINKIKKYEQKYGLQLSFDCYLLYTLLQLVFGLQDFLIIL